jgi:hypothetical protein
VSRDGREAPVDSTVEFRLTNYGANAGWALSPDGTRLAIGLATEAGDDIWVKQLPRGPVSRVSSDSAAEYRPRWRDDGRSLMFGSNRGGGARAGCTCGPPTVPVRIPRSSGRRRGSSRARGRPTAGGCCSGPCGVSRQTGGPRHRGDEARRGHRAGTGSGQCVRRGGDRPVTRRPLARVRVQRDRADRGLPRPFPQTEGGKWQVSNGGGVAPLWARNGRELFYVDQHRDMMTVTGTRSTATRSSGSSARAGWPRSISPKTSATTARWPSRCCARTWPPPSAPSGSTARSRSPPSCSTPTSCRCSTREKPRGSSTT